MMTIQTEALHKALKVLNCLNNDRVYETAWVKGAINACEEALEQPAQEPVAWIKDWADGSKEIVPDNYDNSYPVYTHPAPSWQGLSDDEIAKLNLDGFADKGELDFARAIEQALKEKNT